MGLAVRTLERRANLPHAGSGTTSLQIELKSEQAGLLNDDVLSTATTDLLIQIRDMWVLAA